MNRLFMAIVGVQLMIAGVGCRAQQLQRDQDQFRHALLDLYTEQVIDNLIRAHNAMPIVQLDYTDITGTVTHELNGSVDGSRANSSGAISRLVGLGLGGNKSVQLTVTANPVTDDPALYDAYENFVRKPGRLMSACACPPDGTAHVVRRCGDQYYWVPTEHKNEFYELAVRTTVKRGEPIVAPEDFETTIVGVIGKAEERGRAGDKIQYDMYIHFRDELPNDSGSMKLAIRGQVASLKLVRNPSVKSADEAGRTSTLVLRYTKGAQQINLTPEELAEVLEGKDVSIKLDNSRPLVRHPAPVTPAIRREGRLFRLDQLR